MRSAFRDDGAFPARADAVAYALEDRGTSAGEGSLGLLVRRTCWRVREDERRIVGYVTDMETCECGASLERARRAFVWRSSDFRTCPGCGIVRRCPMPAPEALEHMYRDSYSEERMTEGTTEQASPDAVLEAWADGLCRHWLRPGMRVLDVGAGTGGLVEALRRRGVDAAGVELNQTARAWCLRRRAIALSPELPMAGAAFDVVTLIEVIEHVGRPSHALEAVRSILSERGVLVVSTPNLRGLHAILAQGLWREAQKPFHLCFFRESVLEAALKKAGFRWSLRWRFFPPQARGALGAAKTRALQVMGVPGTLCMIAGRGDEPPPSMLWPPRGRARA